MKTLTILTLLAAFVTGGYAVQDKADIAGFVYYSDTLINGGQDTDAHPIIGGVMKVYKWTNEGTWTYFATADDVTDIDGRFIFTDLVFNDTETPSNGLFQYSDWCKITADENDKIPDWPTALPTVLVRYTHKALREEGMPDASIVRGDVIFLSLIGTPPTESIPEEYILTFGGRFVNIDEATGAATTPNMSTWGAGSPWGNEAYCPHDGGSSYLIMFQGCNHGHWYSTWLDEEQTVRDIKTVWDVADFAWFNYYKDDGTGYPNKEKVGEALRYYSPAWPYWALHGESTETNWIHYDVVEKDYYEE